MSDIQLIVTVLAVAGMVIAALVAARPVTLPEPIPQPVCGRCNEFISFAWAADPDNHLTCKECQAKTLALWEWRNSK